MPVSVRFLNTTCIGWRFICRVDELRWVHRWRRRWRGSSRETISMDLLADRAEWGEWDEGLLRVIEVGMNGAHVDPQSRTRWIKCRGTSGA